MAEEKKHDLFAGKPPFYFFTTKDDNKVVKEIFITTDYDLFVSHYAEQNGKGDAYEFKINEDSKLVAEELNTVAIWKRAYELIKRKLDKKQEQGQGA